MSDYGFRYKHIIWDWNGTLFDDAWICVEIINKLLVKRNLSPIDHESYKKLFRFPVKDYYNKLGFDFSKEPFEASASEFIDTYNKRRKECTLYPDAIEALGFFKNYGIPQSIVSVYKKKYLDELIEYFHIKGFFVDVLGADDHYANSKNDCVATLIQKLNLKPSDVILIGDTIHDYTVAHHIGAGCILIPRGHQSRERLETCKTQIIKSLVEIKDLILTNK